MTMVEKVIRNIDMVMIENSGEHCTRPLLEKLAKAAIEAMREPNEQMMKAGLAINVNDDGFKVFYKAVIDAALKE
jgi:hypothetical protein